ADDVKCANQLAQIHRERLATRHRLDDFGLDLSLSGVDDAIELGLAHREVEVPARQHRNRCLDRGLDPVSHIDDFRPNCAQIGVEWRPGVIWHWVYCTLLRGRASMVMEGGIRRSEKSLKIGGGWLGKTTQKPPKGRLRLRADILETRVTHTRDTTA